MSENLLHDTQKEIEKVVLIAVPKENEDIEQNLTELKELVKTSGAEVVGTLIQNRDRLHPGTYFGKGKIEELKDYIALVEATGIVADDELNSNQLKNLSDLLDIKIMDRTMVILDIFAKRALSAEGKAQVELAQLKYHSTRLVGLGKSLSRQGGGIGTRGPGEKKLETDRRQIRDAISQLEKEIDEIKRHRTVQREKRNKNSMKTLALVGYTNAGKSTIMNLLTDAQVLAEDKLFATLDPVTRKFTLPVGTEVLLTDTVGFIQKLPTTLIRSFNATLEELQYADIFMHIVDSSSPYLLQQKETVEQTIKALGCDEKPMIVVYNKMDRIENGQRPTAQESDNVCYISAKTHMGIDSLRQTIEETLNHLNTQVSVRIPFNDGQWLDYLHKNAQVLQIAYENDGIYAEIILNNDIFDKIQKFIVKKEN